jgi:NADPH-dependent 2,4-dienoyl-CoA reductase/sulfur reductase-like enzyme/rhodanese-related sulfurtransferase
MKIVIIGGVAGGMSSATRARRLDAEAEIIVLEKSGHVSYANCGLPYYVGGVIKEESALLLQTPESLHKRFRLDVRISHEALEIDAVRKVVKVLDLKREVVSEISFDKLILSPGAIPIVPAKKGFERAFTLRTVEDVERIVAQVNLKPKSAVVIGGGYIGVEIAENLSERGISTSLIESTPQLLAPLDAEMATLVAEEMISHGVSLHLGQSAIEIGPVSVTLSSHEVVPADLVILAVGVRPDIKLAQRAGLMIGERGGISVDEFNRTSNADIYAVGDAAEKKDSLDGSAALVPLANLANRHGRVAADHIFGLDVRTVATMGTSIVKVFSLTIAATGWNERRLRAQGKSFSVIHTHPASHAGYYPGAESMALKLIFDSTSGAILGAQGVGHSGVDKRIDVIATAMRGGITAPELADLELAYAPPYGSAKDPVNMLGYVAENRLSGLSPVIQWDEIDAFSDLGYELVDVRSAKEYADGHIPGSTNIPIDELRERVAEIMSKDLVVTCQVGVRGHSASLLLKDLGFNVLNLDGGYKTWVHSPAARNPVLV